MSETKMTTGSQVTVVVDDVHVRYRVPTAAKGQPNLTIVQRVTQRLHGNSGHTLVRAVRGCSFVAREGEAIGIIGRNGSGKSTLLRVIAGLTPPVRGNVLAREVPVLLGVNAALMPQLSGSRNVVLGGLAMGMTKAQVAERFDEIVAMSGVGDSIHLPMSTYSSGMSARLAFSIATAVEPHVLLIDEALNTGDADFRERSQERMDELRANAGTVFLVSHSLTTVRRTCTRVIWLDEGKIRMDGTANDVVKAYRDYYNEVKEARQAGRPVPPPPWVEGRLPEPPSLKLVDDRTRRPRAAAPRHARR